jgi:hypothetical protein
MQKLMDMAEDTPDVLSILIASSNSPKVCDAPCDDGLCLIVVPFQFNELLAANLTDALLMLCHPDNDINEYITIPNGVDVEKLQMEFCALNLEELSAEIVKEFRLGEKVGTIALIQCPQF